ncbi:type II toxin-antitoxin system Phd/YefM family antitoxin [Pseudoclavibacter helvolus]|uniref:type II toxin-antitoxin system Phd/YefM family antitoxin n=1 Tax=Pseudoclavibacter helvolus TaxID=255205 RepID=UPI0008390A44|nr:prevent-host-death protein [Pseudoclavibacter helvolus]
MGASEDINQRDLRLRSREIMDAIERGDSFMVTRGGRRIGELIPLRSPRRFVSRDAFVRGSSALPAMDPDALRRDIDAVARSSD